MRSLRTIRRKLYTNRTLYRKTLDWINRQRARRDLPPLKAILPGKGGEAFNCPVAMSLRKPGHQMFDVEVSRCNTLWVEPGRVKVVTHPDYVKEFIKRFDEGEMNVPERIV